MKLNIVLVEPEIPQNTGNIARTCAAIGAKLHLVKPLGFEISDKYDNETIEEFKNAMDDDLNTSKALAVLFKLVDKIKKGENAQISANTLSYLGSALGFNFALAKKEVSKEELAEIVKPLYKEFNLSNDLDPQELLENIISLRKQARADKDWEKSDEIRDTLLKYKIQLKDSKEGTTWEII